MELLITIASGTLLLIIGAAITGLVQWRRDKLKRIADEATIASAALLARIDELEKRAIQAELQTAILQRDVAPITVAMMKMMAAKLANDHTPVLDELLIKLGPPNILTKDDKILLAKVLLETVNTTDSRITDAQKLAAAAMPFVIRMVEEDLANASPEDIYEIVSIPQDDKKQTEEEEKS